MIRGEALEPIKIGAFTLTATGMTVAGRPTFAEWDRVGEFIRRAHQASGWWLADWVKYGEKRDDWRELIDHVVDVTGYSEKTIRNAKYIGENVTPSHRRADVSFGVHSEVAPLPQAEQDVWLEKAATEGWGPTELRKQIRAAKRTKVLEGQAKLEGMYRVIYADPPWSYNSSGGASDGAFKSAGETYPTMDIEALCKLPVKAHALPDSVLFLWVPNSLILDNPGPRELIEAWGFTDKSGFVWDKVNGNFGHYVRVHHEHLRICTRGSCTPDEPTPQPDSVQVVRREAGAEHSSKPEEFRRLIEKLYTRGPYLELFARQRAEGWSSFGNDARLWAEEAKAS